MDRANELRYLILATQREGVGSLRSRYVLLASPPSQAEVLTVLHEEQPLSLIEVGARLVCETGSVMIKQAQMRGVGISVSSTLCLTRTGRSFYPSMPG